jgi:uncharacterized membrane protein YgdD (TMEM256/DUF423 family)
VKGSRWIALGSVSAAAAIAAGAFGAHALRARLDGRSLEIFETAARYHLIHSLALVAVGIVVDQELMAARRSGVAFAVGIVVFCGSLYALALTQVKVLGAITPIGGVAFIVGWLLLALAAWRKT